MWNNQVRFEDLKGKTFKSIYGMNAGSEGVIFRTDDNDEYLMTHIQDCCEYVTLLDVCGDPEDLIGSPITLAIESTSNSDPECELIGSNSPGLVDDSFTWTFYNIATEKGYVTLRWFGTSNGYYSESVEIFLEPKGS